MSMSKKDYEAIARIAQLAINNPNHFYIDSADGYKSGAYSLAVALCEYMRNDNPRFDRARFLAACGVQS